MQPVLDRITVVKQFVYSIDSWCPGQATRVDCDISRRCRCVDRLDGWSTSAAATAIVSNLRLTEVRSSCFFLLTLNSDKLLFGTVRTLWSISNLMSSFLLSHSLSLFLSLPLSLFLFSFRRRIEQDEADLDPEPRRHFLGGIW